MQFLKLVNKGDQISHFYHRQAHNSRTDPFCDKIFWSQFCLMYSLKYRIIQFPIFYVVAWATHFQFLCGVLTPGATASTVLSRRTKLVKPLYQTKRPTAGCWSCPIFTKTAQRENNLHFKYTLWPYSWKSDSLYAVQQYFYCSILMFHCSIVPFGWIAELSFSLFFYQIGILWLSLKVYTNCYEDLWFHYYYTLDFSLYLCNNLYSLLHFTAFQCQNATDNFH